MNADVAPHESNVFIEQAEYLGRDAFESLTASHPSEAEIIRKLCQPGAKLITGPRGAGKTTFLRKAFNRMAGDKRGQAFPVYVNYRSSLRLEPLYRSNANASYWFNLWLALNIVKGAISSLDELDVAAEDFSPARRDQIDAALRSLELGRIDQTSSAADFGSTVDKLDVILQRAASLAGKRRTVLLLDDAAHAFSQEQQRDFFEFFARLKSSTVAPKAAVYPGVTSYAPTFHIGHDAEEIDIWLRPDSAEYLAFTHSLLEKRLSPTAFAKLQEQGEIGTLLSLAAFGLPRSLLNMIRDLGSGVRPVDDEAIPSINLSRAAVLGAIKSCIENSRKIFLTLRPKLPMYATFVDHGLRFYDSAIDQIKRYNRHQNPTQKSVTIAVKRPIPPEVIRLLSLFQYSGLLQPRGEVSRGEKGVFELYAIHYSGLIERNAILTARSGSISELAAALAHRDAHAITRTTAASLLGTEDVAAALRLDLPPCAVCGTPRPSEEARFCAQCGSPLVIASIFETAVNQDLSSLPITQHRARSIKEQSRLRTVKDILMDEDHKELRRVKMIGPIWAGRIHRYAQEFIA